MKALILGFVVIIIAVLAIIPAGLGWGEDVLAFLRGSLPVIACFIGLILIFVGITDIKDRVETKKNQD
jgi:type IV secretory pathway VirB2 component (pilin)